MKRKGLFIGEIGMLWYFLQVSVPHALMKVYADNSIWSKITSCLPEVTKGLTKNGKKGGM
ncbi:hypothetical protein L484_005687 [Morus notabilis]|uniref:Uncharacterized protein n=1 Tax=Morus notabilis TaxID=981085 RepID=W9RBI6_9ROSA|nr:hypothetical protein L484_005687 [Morus notabilis]